MADPCHDELFRLSTKPCWAPDATVLKSLPGMDCTMTRRKGAFRALKPWVSKWVYLRKCCSRSPWSYCAARAFSRCLHTLLRCRAGRFSHLCRNRYRFLAGSSTGPMPIGSVLPGPHPGMRCLGQQPSQPATDRSAPKAAEAVTDTAAKPAGSRRRVFDSVHALEQDGIAWGPLSSPAPDAAQQERREPGPPYLCMGLFSIFSFWPCRGAPKPGLTGRLNGKTGD
jgi:hypothetical protein